MPGLIFLATLTGTLFFNSPVFNLNVTQLKTEVPSQTIGDPIALSNSDVDCTLVVILSTALVFMLKLAVKVSKVR